ncbi:LysR substrate-binding domain-containing protein [Pseudomonas sp. NPDC007930]|uniref:LysR family transcriptional regulator n=1 Tax=Pseudomonas sp. NPDC007930 TaxID=3364417 RepID=UPI0036ECE5E9
MNLFQNMRVFAAVAQAGGFSAAARQLDMTTANVSRAVAALEAHLRTRLLQRSTRRLALTEAGERYLRRSLAILGQLAEAEAEAVAAVDEAAGKLQVHAMVGIGMHYVIDLIASYRLAHPRVRFDLRLSNRVPDLIEEGYDMAIVLARQLPDSAYVAQRLGTIHSVLCAAPNYLARRGAPAHPDELAGHDCLMMNSLAYPEARWHLAGPGGEHALDFDEPALRVNSIEAMGVAIGAGLGIGVLPSYTAISGLRSGRLVQVLAGYRLQSLNLYALMPSRLFVDAKARTWLEHLRQALPPALLREEEELG